MNKKLNESIYSSMTIINDYDLDSFNNKIIELNDVINRNNTFTEKFPTIINAERDRYKSHLVALFLKKSKFSIKHKKSEKAGIEILKLNEKVKKYRTEINRLNSLKESDKEGCAQFNSFVQSFLSREDIEIKLNEETKKFNLIRDSIIASNLSEGEKMAISFSHFLVTLKSIEQKNELKDHIIFIDDPISSLDGNHIFQINSLLKDIFFS
ncbi:AAA family ATPase [Flavobacterium sp.]|uniref:AAA family ATPase n=1 Tax=Flavobacterium sp. TaxID=239 RepID=UPI0037504E63